MILVGQSVALRVRFSDSRGRPVNPSDATLTIRDPRGVVVTKSLVDLVKSSDGDYHYPLTLSVAGNYLWDCVTTSPPTATGVQEIPVGESRVVPQ